MQKVADVNDLGVLREAIASAQAESDRPSLIICRTHIAFGAPHAVDTAKAHGSPLGAEEVAATKKALGWDPDKSFYVPDEVRAHLNRVERGNELETEWNTRFSRWSEAFPQARERWDDAWAGRIGAWELPEFAPGEELATRAAGKTVMQAFKHAAPTMIGGAGRPRRVDEDRAVGRRPLLGAAGRVATSRSASASTPWARSSTASPCTAAA